MQKQEKKPSEFIDEFLQFLKYCDKEYKECVQEVWKYDKMTQDHIHDIEFAHNYEQRCKVATEIHKMRNERRGYKNRVAFVENIAKFCADKQNKQFIEKLKKLLDDQKHSEEFVLGEKHYNRRGDGSNDTD